jgi:glycosyltransferase involved in cell wall biosynthesis
VELVTTLELEHRTRILPARRDIPHVLSAIDVLVLPSIHPEGFGLVLIEAMAMGKPVIGTALGGVPEIVDREPPVGFLVPPRDADALATILSRLASDRQLSCELGRRARDCVEREFDIRAVVQELQKLYLELLEGK